MTNTAWSDTDPINTSWSGVDPTNTAYGIGLRHTYGTEYNETTRIVYGDNVLYGGGLSLSVNTSWT
tara:strand:- start:6611 stop:6808 length:198 start_codon:yes stop_codon:yes gene_type:complete